MDTRIRRKLSMASRALDFARQHTSDDPAFKAVLERLTAQVALANTLHNDGREATIDERAAILRRTNLRRQLRDMGRHIVRVAELVVKQQPELAGEFVAPRPRATNRTFLSDSQVLFRKASEHGEVFASLGLSEGLLERMEQALSAYEEYGSTANVHRAGHVSARENITDVVADCMDLIDVLDSFYRALFADDPGKLTAWLGARDVYGRSPRPVQAEGNGVIGTLPPAPTPAQDTSSDAQEEAA